MAESEENDDVRSVCEGRVVIDNVRNGGAGNLYHLKFGFAVKKASLYWKEEETGCQHFDETLTITPEANTKNRQT